MSRAIKGTVRDIRTGRAIGRTDSLTDTFVWQVQNLIESGDPFYMVHGRCRTMDTRQLADDMLSLKAFPVIYDPQMPSDTLWIFAGTPDQLGFAC